MINEKPSVGPKKNLKSLRYSLKRNRPQLRNLNARKKLKLKRRPTRTARGKRRRRHRQRQIKRIVSRLTHRFNLS